MFFTTYSFSLFAIELQSEVIKDLEDGGDEEPICTDEKNGDDSHGGDEGFGEDTEYEGFEYDIEGNYKRQGWISLAWYWDTIVSGPNASVFVVRESGRCLGRRVVC